MREAFKVYVQKTHTFNVLVKGFAVTRTLVLRFRMRVSSKCRFILDVAMGLLNFNKKASSSTKFNSKKYLSATLTRNASIGASFSVRKHIVGMMSMYRKAKLSVMATLKKFVGKLVMHKKYSGVLHGVVLGRFRRWSDLQGMTWGDVQNWTIRDFDYIEIE